MNGMKCQAIIDLEEEVNFFFNRCIYGCFQEHIVFLDMGVFFYA